ncbi:Neurotriminlike, partial [Caligus rogercresseyi]
DTHLLTIGRYTYTSDLRFKAIHKVLSEDYLLQIKPTTKRDGGKYECQISTTPPLRHIVNLEIA